LLQPAEGPAAAPIEIDALEARPDRSSSSAHDVRPRRSFRNSLNPLSERRLCAERRAAAKWLHWSRCDYNLNNKYFFFFEIEINTNYEL